MSTSKELYEKALKYFKEENNEQNKRLAFNACKDSADMGNESAMNLLGVFYAVGYGVTKDDNLALKCFKKGGWTDVTTYNIGILVLRSNQMFSRAMVAADFKTSSSSGEIEDKKMAKLMMDMSSYLAGNIQFNPADVFGKLSFIKTMESSFCFMDADGSINWVDFEGHISENAKRMYDNILSLEEEKEIAEKEAMQKKKLEEERKRQQEEERKRQQVAKWKNDNLCQYCGNKFKGIFRRRCSVCGIRKDY